jgi:Oxysterol-binding protein
VYAEHTSHHPPITNFHLQAPDDSFNYYGFYEFTGSMGANSLKSGLRGPNNVVFADGQHIRFRIIDWKLGGTVMGERTVEADGSCFFEDLTNHRKAVIIFSTYKSSGFWKKTESGSKDEFQGMIYKCQPILNPAASAKTLYSKSAHDVKDLKDLKDVVKPICNIKGSWLKNLTIDNKVYWDIDQDLPDRFKPCSQDLLYSDWRYREDLLWLKYGY